MNIEFMAGLNSKGTASKNPVDSKIVSQGQGRKRDNKTHGFFQFLEKSKQVIKSDTGQKPESRPGKTEADYVGKTRTTEISKVSKPSTEDVDSTELHRTNELSEEINSQLLVLVNLLSTFGIAPGEVNNSPGSNQVQNFYGSAVAQPEALGTAQQKAHIMQLLQMASKLTGEMNVTGDAGLKEALQNLLTMTDVQLTNQNSQIDTRFAGKILEALKNSLKDLKQEGTASILNTATSGVAGGILSEKKTGEAGKVQSGLAASGIAVEAVKQPPSLGLIETKVQNVSETVVETGHNDSENSTSSDQGSSSGFPKRDIPGKTLNVTGLGERTTPQPFALENQVNGSSGFEVQNPSGLEQSSETAKVTRNIFGQIAQKAKLMVAPGVTEMQIQLKPEVLGKLNLTISSENGLVTAKFNAESHMVKAIIEANLGSLKDALTQQGVKVDQLVVDVGTQSHQQGFERRNSYHNGTAAGKTGTVSVKSEDVEKLFSRDGHSGAVNAYYGSTVEFTA